MPTKLVVTDVSAMKKKYKASWPKVRQAVGRLARKDAARGITTTLVALDDANLGASRAKARQPETFKAAIDHVWGLHHQPDYILILGGPDIVPHQSLRNTVPPDDDPDVPSDLPYAWRRRHPTIPRRSSRRRGWSDACRTCPGTDPRGYW